MVFQHLYTNNINKTSAMISPLSDGISRIRSRSYGSQSVDSGVEDGDGNALVLVLDSVMHSPTLQR